MTHRDESRLGEAFMPVQLDSRPPGEHAEPRIEIVPLIDVMFFLLASFMLVSLSMVNLKSVNVNLPGAATATPENRSDFADISVNRDGAVFLDTSAVAANELAHELQRRLTADPKLRVIISGDREARHGDIMRVLDIVRSAGIDKVAFEVSEISGSNSP
jgi:biopolymer transport protein ExbD